MSPFRFFDKILDLQTRGRHGKFFLYSLDKIIIGLLQHESRLLQREVHQTSVTFQRCSHYILYKYQIIIRYNFIKKCGHFETNDSHFKFRNVKFGFTHKIKPRKLLHCTECLERGINGGL